MAAALPVMSPERGAEATHIFQGSLLLVSGVYYPVDVLPRWLQPLSWCRRPRILCRLVVNCRHGKQRFSAGPSCRLRRVRSD